jgi:multicomponent Na+:H+ antiporter subunit B
VTPDPSPLVVVLLALILGVGLIVATARDVLVATVVFGAYSLGLAILWVVFRAPDVGLTEAAVGAGVTTSLFLVAIAKTTPPTGERAFSLRWDPRALLIGAAVVGALGLSVPALPAVGEPAAPAFADDAAAAYYLGTTADFGIDNVVTAVLVVFRGFDTFGEIAVVFAAGVAVLVVLEQGQEGRT